MTRASIKIQSHKNEKNSIKKKTMRNISNYLDKKLIDLNKDNSISINLRKKSSRHNIQHYEEVKSKSNSEKSKIAEEKILPNKVQDKKLFISPIVLLEILPMDRIKENSIFEKFKVSNSTKSPNTDSIRKSSRSKIRINAYNKTEVQNISDEQMCISRIESNANKEPTMQQELMHESNDTLTKTKLKLLDNSVLDEQIDDKDTDNLKIKELNKEILVEQEVLSSVNKNVKNSGKKESLFEKKKHLDQITAKKNSFDQSTNLQEKCIESVKILLNQKKDENCKHKHTSIVQEIINDFTEDDEIITEKECVMDLTVCEKIQNLNECFAVNQLVINNLNEEKCNDTTENNKENLLDSKGNDKINSFLDNEPLAGSSECDLIDEEITPNTVMDDTCNNEDYDEDDEEIIYYYINSANEIIKKVNVKKGSSVKADNMKAAGITSVVVDNCKKNMNISQPIINDNEVVINVKNQQCKNGSTKTINIDKTELNEQRQMVNIDQPEISIKDKTLDNLIEKSNTTNINKSNINEENKNMNVDLPIIIEHDYSINAIQLISTKNAEIIATEQQNINTATSEAININATLVNEKEKILNINQPEVIDNEHIDDDQFGIIEKDKNLNQCVVNKANIIKSDEPIVNGQKRAIFVNQSVETINDININQTVVSENDEISYIDQPATIDKNDIINIDKSTITDKHEGINIDQLITTEKDKNLEVDKSVHIEKDETINASQTTGTKKDCTDQNNVAIIRKDKNINLRKTTLIEKANTININYHAIIEKDKTITISQLVNNEEDNTVNASVIIENNEISKVDQCTISGKDTKINHIQPLIDTDFNESSSTVSERTTNVYQPLTIENVNTLNDNRSLNTKNTECTNVNQVLTTENNATIEIDQPLFTEQDNITNISRNVITTKHATVEKDQHTINEINLVSEIKVEEVMENATDEMANQINFDSNPNDNMINDRYVHIHEHNVQISDANIVIHNIMSENIKIEDVDIPEDNIVTENNLEDALISNKNASINSESSKDRESDTLTASEDETNNASIQSKNNNEQKNSISDNGSVSDGSMDRSNAMFISFMETYQRMKRDVNAANSLLTLNGESDDINYADIGPEILHISDDSDNEIMSVEKENEDVFENQKLSTVATVNPVLSVNPSNSANLVNPVNPIKRKILLPNGGAIISASKLYGCGDGISIQERNEHLFPCPKCNRVYQGEDSYNKHKYKCNQQIPLQCVFCPRKMKNRRSVFEHLRKIHGNEVTEHEIKEIVNNIVKEANFRINIRTPMSASMIIVPEFVKLFCNKCGKIYDRIRPDYYRECETCNVPLLVFCQRCNTRCPVSSEVSSHVNGDCKLGEPISCPHCSFVSRQRYLIQRHIESSHKTAFSSIKAVPCAKGCGRKFESTLGMRRHKKYCGTKPNLRCKFCRYKTRHRSAIKMHMQQHVLRNDTELNEQGFSDSGSSDSTRMPILGVDESSVRKLMEPYCLNCKMVVPMPPKYLNTCRNCGTRLIFNCMKCHLLSSRSHDYRHVRVHVIRCHTEKIYKCHSCNRRFAYYYDYNYHKEKCDKNMSFRCKICPYRSNLQKGLQAHMKRVHPNGILEFHHCSKCLKSFNCRNNLRKHQRNFCGFSPNFSCAHCDFGTRAKFSLMRHIQNKHSEIFNHCRFQCVYCQKVYNNLYAHDTHVIICSKKPECIGEMFENKWIT